MIEKKGEDVFERYIIYVEDVIKRYKAIGDLAGADDSDLDPSSINRALVDLYPVSSGLLAEYQRSKTVSCQLKNAFQRWYDPLFAKAKQDVIRDYAHIEVKGVKPSVTEYETRARMDNADEYYRKKEELDAAEIQEAFLQRMLDKMNSFDRILTTLSTNCRSDLYRLGIERRAASAVDKKVRTTRSP
jgi:hypothetical protein